MEKIERSSADTEIIVKILYYEIWVMRKKARAHMYSCNPNTKKGAFSLVNSMAGMYFLGERVVLRRW